MEDGQLTGQPLAGNQTDTPTLEWFQDNRLLKDYLLTRVTLPGLRSFSRKNDERRDQEYLQVQPQRPMFDIINIEKDSFIKG